jgi:glycosyltransferase involved in cell wall biosynthesis
MRSNDSSQGGSRPRRVENDRDGSPPQKADDGDGDESTSDTEPLVSVVLPTYDRPEFLADAVRSVLDQTYDNLELIVVDDGSPEPAEAKLEQLSYDGLTDLTVIRHHENRGANVARNAGIRAATGTYVAFLDDDDFWLESKVERQVETFQRANESVGVVYTGTLIINDDEEIVAETVPRIRGDVTKDFLRGEQVAGSFSKVMIRSSLIDRAGLPDERFPSWQDREWYLRLSQYCKFEFVDEPLTIRRIASHEQISDDFEAKRDVTYPLFVEKHRRLAAEYGRLTERKFVADRARAVAAAGLRAGCYWNAVWYSLISLRYYPFSWRTYAFLFVAVGGPFTTETIKRLKRSLAS